MDKEIFIGYVKRLYNVKKVVYMPCPKTTSFHFVVGSYITMISFSDEDILNNDALKLFDVINNTIHTQRMGMLKEIMECDRWNMDIFS